MKNMQCFFRWKGAATVLAALTFFLLVSCEHGAQLKDYDISEIYGYKFYGDITSSSGTTLKPSFILYDDNRAAWNMSVDGMNDIQFYYYALKEDVSNYTLYWFGAADKTAASIHDDSKAVMKAKIGINALDKIVILLIDDKFTGNEKMANHRVPMQKQTNVPRTLTPPKIPVDFSIKDEVIEIPSSVPEADWEGASSYVGAFDYLLGPGGTVERGHGTCGKDTKGNDITPKIGIEKDAAGSYKVTVKVHPFAYGTNMGTQAFDISGVKVRKSGTVYYLQQDLSSVPARTREGKATTLKDVTVRGKLEDGKLTLRVSFIPDKMSLRIVEIFKSK